MLQKTRIVFMFSGQGSHYFHMGKELYERDNIFRSNLDALDRMAAQLIGASVIDYIYDDNKNISQKFDRTLYSHPAIFMLEYSLAATLIHYGVRPDIMLGSSMGTFVAAAIAGCLTRDDALSIVVRQAQILEHDCQRGGMMAILESPEVYRRQPELYLNCELAGINMDKHFVVSGLNNKLLDIAKFLDASDIVYQHLNVSYAFHSKLILKAESEFKALLNQVPLARAKIPVICCSKTWAVNQFTCDDFWDIAMKPIWFKASIENLEREGNHTYIDVGPSGTLATFVKHNLQHPTNSKPTVILSPFSSSLERFLKVIDESSVLTSPLF